MFYVQPNLDLLSFNQCELWTAKWASVMHSRRKQYASTYLRLYHTFTILYLPVKPKPLSGLGVNTADSEAYDDTARWKLTLSPPLCLSHTDGLLRWRWYTLGETDQKRGQTDLHRTKPESLNRHLVPCTFLNEKDYTVGSMLVTMIGVLYLLLKIRLVSLHFPTPILTKSPSICIFPVSVFVLQNDTLSPFSFLPRNKSRKRINELPKCIDRFANCCLDQLRHFYIRNPLTFFFSPNSIVEVWFQHTSLQNSLRCTLGLSRGCS